VSIRRSYAVSPVDETPIFYEVFEPASPSPAPPLVLINGIGCDGYVWKYLRRDLGSDRRLIHWHFRGHGRTPLPRNPHRIEIPDLADDLSAVLDDSETRAAVLCGHSMGVQVALETYRRHPDRVLALVLLCGAPENPLKTFRGQRGAEILLPQVRRAVERAPRLINQAARLLVPTRITYALAARLEINADLLSLADFMPYLRGLSRVEVPFFLSMLSAAGEHSAVDLLPQVRVPALVVAGERDGFTPPALSRQMAESIPGSELFIVRGGSHTAPLERPAEVDEIVRDFLTRRVGIGPESAAVGDA
jgi:pimeloyl-ACP methyl ester carboxylesterase